MQAACSDSTDISLEMLVLRTIIKKEGLNNNNTIHLHILPDYKA
jgi:hypothetical protein